MMAEMPWGQEEEPMRTADGARELLETDIDGFVGVCRFVARNDLWDDVQQALAEAGVASIVVSVEPIRVIRKLIDEVLRDGDRLDDAGHKHAQVIAECACGVGTPGPPTPVTPHGGGDGGTDGGHPK
jgi:hypothetical protein